MRDIITLMKTCSKLPKRNNANSGKKAHNENQPAR